MRKKTRSGYLGKKAWHYASCKGLRHNEDNIDFVEIKLIKNDKIERLNAPPERKRKSKLNDNQRRQILEWTSFETHLY